MTAELSESAGFSMSKFFDGLLQGATGIAGSEKEEWLLSAGKVLQGYRSWQFIKILKAEWERYREIGRIKEDYEQTEQHKTCLQELLNFLDADSPDEIRFNAMKQMFLNAATEGITERDSILPQQFMAICRTLSSGEIILLSSIYELAEAGEQLPDTGGAAAWLQKMAGKSALKFTELVEIHETSLIKKKLLSSRQHSDGSGVVGTEHYRLTPLGYEVCRFIVQCDIDSVSTSGLPNPPDQTAREMT